MISATRGYIMTVFQAITGRRRVGFAPKSLVFAALMTVALPIAAKAETLADALVGAYGHSGLLEQNRALLRAADEDVAIAASALRPILNWTAGINRTNSRSFSGAGFGLNQSYGTDFTLGLSASLLLYDGGQSKLGVEAAKETVLATRQGLIAVEQSVLLRAVTAYVSVRRDIEFVSLRQNNVRLITQELRAARDRFEVGEVTRTDVALAEARLAEARAGLAAAQGNLQISIEEYRSVVGRKPRHLQQPRGLPRLDSHVDTARARALRTHPDLVRVQHEVAAAELNILRARAAMGPTITLDGSVSFSEALDRTNPDDSVRSGQIGVNLSAPIYQGGRLSANARRSQAQRDAVRGNLHTVRHTISQNVGSAYAQLAVARASLEATERQIRAARVAFQGVREEATLGARTTLDVLDAEQELLDAQAARISALADQFVAAYTVLSSTGMLTAERLKLNVVQYDPAAYYNLVKRAPVARSKQGRQLDKVLRSLGKE